DGSIDTKSFVNDFANDLKPYIEKNYRVKLGSAYTALAGLSQGGLEVTETIQAHPDFFAYVNVMSSGWFVNNPQMYEDGEKALAAAAPTLKKTLKYLKFTVGGEEDGAYPNCHGMMKVYDKLGIKYDYSDMPGGHSWYVWRHDLYNFAQKLFKLK
ncbi:MAG: endo-1,4-beta-xylanase Z, partial [Bacteroidales bacterium]|nr:endo-1,4-beta-xylanase Z [Bacteroidales bacterium]